MKIKPEHYEYISKAIQSAMTEFPSIRDEFNKGNISAMRYRWDLSYAARLSTWLCENVYPYADDSHIDTALRRITGTK